MISENGGHTTAYQARCEARPAFQRALEDHTAAFARYWPLSVPASPGDTAARGKKL